MRWQVAWINICTQTVSKYAAVYIYMCLNSLRARRKEQHFANDIFKRNFFNENVWISINISLKFLPKGPINNIPALVQIMAWRRSGDKPLSEPMMVSLPTHICVTRPQWVKCLLVETSNMACGGPVVMKCILSSAVIIINANWSHLCHIQFYNSPLFTVIHYSSWICYLLCSHSTGL